MICHDKQGSHDDEQGKRLVIGLSLASDEIGCHVAWAVPQFENGVQETSFNAKERREEIRERVLECDTCRIGWLSTTTTIITFIYVTAVLAHMSLCLYKRFALFTPDLPYIESSAPGIPFSRNERITFDRTNCIF